MKWLKCLAIAVIYFLLARISYLTTLPAHVINGPALAWLPTGFAVAAILVEGYWIWPGIMLGSLLSAFPSIETWPGIAGFVLADTIDPLLATWLPRRILGREFDLCCGWDVTVFILVVAFGSSVFSATVGSIAVILAHGNDAGIFWQTFIVWWVSDFLSVLIFAPFLLAWSHKLNTPAEAAGKAELFIGAGICAGMIYFIFSMPLGKDTGNFIYWLIPLVIWLGFRAGRRGVSTGIFLLAVITIVATSLGKGPFVEASIEESFLYVQSFLTVISILGLLLTAALGERTKAIQDRDNFFLLASHELNTPLTVLGMQSCFI
ncbi:MAG: MASE1 domain-containing protein, partial [Bdellovibrionota bacterium]